MLEALGDDVKGYYLIKLERSVPQVADARSLSTKAGFLDGKIEFMQRRLYVQ